MSCQNGSVGTAVGTVFSSSPVCRSSQSVYGSTIVECRCFSIRPYSHSSFERCEPPRAANLWIVALPTPTLSRRKPPGYLNAICERQYDAGDLHAIRALDQYDTSRKTWIRNSTSCQICVYMQSHHDTIQKSRFKGVEQSQQHHICQSLQLLAARHYPPQ